MSAFQNIASGTPASLVEAALELARDEYPQMVVREYTEWVAHSGERFRLSQSPDYSARRVLRHLNDFFFGELGFRGDTENYYDPRNSYLNEVIDRRQGIPISLSILYRELAAAAGVYLIGVNLPGHFMLALQTPQRRRLYIDVFAGGRWLNWQQCAQRVRHTLGRWDGTEADLRPMTDRDLLVRSLRNLKGIFSGNDLQRSLRVQERIVQLLPNDVSEICYLAQLYFYTGKPTRARGVLQDLVGRHPALANIDEVREILRHAERETVLLN